MYVDTPRRQVPNRTIEIAPASYSETTPYVKPKKIRAGPGALSTFIIQQRYLIDEGDLALASLSLLPSEEAACLKIT